MQLIARDITLVDDTHKIDWRSQKDGTREEKKTEIENAAGTRAREQEGRRESLGYGHVSQWCERHRIQSEGRRSLMLTKKIVKFKRNCINFKKMPSSEDISQLSNA